MLGNSHVTNEVKSMPKCASRRIKQQVLASFGALPDPIEANGQLEVVNRMVGSVGPGQRSLERRMEVVK
jgi:hypothetical protein